jgi:hypothetical protein
MPFVARRITPSQYIHADGFVCVPVRSSNPLQLSRGITPAAPQMFRVKGEQTMGVGLKKLKRSLFVCAAAIPQIKHNTISARFIFYLPLPGSMGDSTLTVIVYFKTEIFLFEKDDDFKALYCIFIGTNAAKSFSKARLFLLRRLSIRSGQGTIDSLFFK